MLRVECRERGPIPQEQVELVEFELAEPDADEVVVRMVAATINPSDLLTLTGKYGQFWGCTGFPVCTLIVNIRRGNAT